MAVTGPATADLTGFSGPAREVGSHPSPVFYLRGHGGAAGVPRHTACVGTPEPASTPGSHLCTGEVWKLSAHPRPAAVNKQSH